MIVGLKQNLVQAMHRPAGLVPQGGQMTDDGFQFLLFLRTAESEFTDFESV
jgi:hypothetical protein